MAVLSTISLSSSWIIVNNYLLHLHLRWSILLFSQDMWITVLFKLVCLVVLVPLTGNPMEQTLFLINYYCFHHYCCLIVAAPNAIGYILQWIVRISLLFCVFFCWDSFFSVLVLDLSIVVIILHNSMTILVCTHLRITEKR